MVKYITEHPHKTYEKHTTEELDYIDQTLKNSSLSKGLAKFRPTRDIITTMFLIDQLHQIDIEKEGGSWFACIYTGKSDGEGNEITFFVEAENFSLAVSLAAYEYVQADKLN